MMFWFFKHTHVGLNLRAVGENPATADACGINVTKYKYLATCVGAGIKMCIRDRYMYRRLSLTESGRAM